MCCVQLLMSFVYLNHRHLMTHIRNPHPMTATVIIHFSAKFIAICDCISPIAIPSRNHSITTSHHHHRHHQQHHTITPSQSPSPPLSSPSSPPQHHHHHSLYHHHARSLIITIPFPSFDWWDKYHQKNRYRHQALLPIRSTSKALHLLHGFRKTKFTSY